MANGGFARRGRREKAAGRLFRWAIVSALAGPAVWYGLSELGQYVWSHVPHVSAVITVAAFRRFGTVFGLARGELVEMISFVTITLFASLPPALATGLFREGWGARMITAAAVFPGWILVMSVAAIVIYDHAPRIDADLQRTAVVCDFLVSFAALVTTAGLALLLWTQLFSGATKRAETLRSFDQSTAPPAGLQGYLREDARVRDRR